MTLSVFLAGLASGAGLIVAIGAQNAFVLRQGLQRRFVGTVVAVCVIADACLILAGVGGMGLLVHSHATALQVVRYAGAAFLVCYGLLAARRAWRGESGLLPADAAVADRWRVLLTCLGFTLLNPHVYLDTVVLLGSLAAPFGDPGRWQFAAGACCASLLWFLLLGYGARLLLPVFRSPRAWRVLDVLVAVMMLSLAFLLLR